MAIVPRKNRLLSVFSFLDNRKKEDISIYKTYMKYKKINGDKSHPNTIRDMIKAIGSFMGLYEKSVLLLSVKHTDKGYEVDTIIDTSVLDKENRWGSSH